MRSINHYKRFNANKKFTGINVTPLTDIALTLLVVFMIAPPVLMQSSINIKLPVIGSSQDIKAMDKPLVILIDNHSHIFIEKKQFTLKTLEKFLYNYKKSIIINADKSVNYETVIKVLDVVKKQGINKVSFGIEVKSVS